MEKPAQRAVLARAPDLRVDVLKVPHHGSRKQVAEFSAATGAQAAITSVTGKIRAKARLLAGMALDAEPATLTWSNGAWVGGDGSDPAQVKTVEDIALYAHGTGELPPGVEGGLDAQAVYSD